MALAQDSQVEIVTEGEFRVIRANGLPDHPTGEFPNPGNPNAITPQYYRFRVPLRPQMEPAPRAILLSRFGVAVNGVPFDPGADEYWNRDRSSGWQYEALSPAIDLGLDAHRAHVQRTGAYHYHGIPEALVRALGGRSDRHSPLVGYAADGFPIYARVGYVDPVSPELGVAPLRSSYRLRIGNRPGGPRGAYDGSFVRDYEYVVGIGDLDMCNGRHGATPEHPDGTYAYFLTDDFPVIPRCWRGAPDPSFLRGPGPEGRIGPDGRRGSPGLKDGPPRGPRAIRRRPGEHPLPPPR